MPAVYCATCGAQFAPAEAPPPGCPVCEDPRQYVPESGQRWVAPEELAAAHRVVLRPEGDYTGVGLEPDFAIGQRALLVPLAGGRLMWDCVPYAGVAGAAEVERDGGVAAIAISHPHYYTGMVEWARRFGCRVLLHAADAEWIMRPDPVVELWDGDTLELEDGVTLIRAGGHFAGGTILHDARTRALLAGDIVQVIPDRRHVGFMYSYPNLIPLAPEAVERIAAALAPYAFETVYGAWWDRVVRRDGSAVVRRSAERYVRAVRGEWPVRTRS